MNAAPASSTSSLIDLTTTTDNTVCIVCAAQIVPLSDQHIQLYPCQHSTVCRGCLTTQLRAQNNTPIMPWDAYVDAVEHRFIKAACCGQLVRGYTLCAAQTQRPFPAPRSTRSLRRPRIYCQEYDLYVLAVESSLAVSHTLALVLPACEPHFQHLQAQVRKDMWCHREIVGMISEFYRTYAQTSMSEALPKSIVHRIAIILFRKSPAYQTFLNKVSTPPPHALAARHASSGVSLLRAPLLALPAPAAAPSSVVIGPRAPAAAAPPSVVIAPRAPAAAAPSPVVIVPHASAAAVSASVASSASSSAASTASSANPPALPVAVNRHLNSEELKEVHRVGGMGSKQGIALLQIGIDHAFAYSCKSEDVIQLYKARYGEGNWLLKWIREETLAYRGVQFESVLQQFKSIFSHALHYRETHLVFTKLQRNKALSSIGSNTEMVNIFQQIANQINPEQRDTLFLVYRIFLIIVKIISVAPRFRTIRDAIVSRKQKIDPDETETDDEQPGQSKRRKVMT